MYDYHTHSHFSSDGYEQISALLDKAVEIGVKELAVTDHYDPDYPNPKWPFLIDFDKYHNELLEAEERYRNSIRLVKGIEIGIQHGETMEKCHIAAGNFNYDFIIGSFHCFEGFDIEIANYEKMKPEEAVMRYYEYIFKCLKQYKDYDIVGHFNIIDRYMPYVPDYEPYMDLIAEILKIVIADEKGLELNTSSYRYGMGNRTTASKEILLLYKDLCRAKAGCEPIVTFGSDAHRKDDIVYRYNDSLEYLRGLGFDYIALFKDREKKLVRI